MKTLTMYLRAAKTEAEEAGIEVDGMAESTAKLRSELLKLTGGKLDIQIDDNNFKSSFQILKELSEIWDEIGEKSGDVSQANILNLLGGKRNANILSSIITNFDDAIKASETAGDSMGSAWAENEKYLDSIEGKTKQCQAAFETFANSVINSGAVKAFVDMQRAVIEFATGLRKLDALIPMIITVASVIKTMKDGLAAQGATKSILSLIAGGNGSIDEAVKSLSMLSNAQLQIVSNNLQVAVSTGAVDGAVATGATQVAAYATSMVGATGAATGFAGALNAVKAAFATNPIGIALLAITAGIAMIKHGINSVSEAAEAAIENANNIKEAYDSATSEYSNNIKDLEELSDRFDELNEKVGENGTQGSLTNEEYDEYLDIVRQIIDITPSLANHYTNVGESIQGGYVNVLDEAIEKNKELMKYEQDKYLSSGNALFEGYAEKYRTVRDNIGVLNDKLYETIDDILNHNLDPYIADVIGIQERIEEIFSTASGDVIWDVDPNMKNLQEMVSLYDNMDDLVKDLSAMTRTVEDSAGNLIEVPLFDKEDLVKIKNSMRAYADAAKSFAETKQEAFQYLYTYMQVDLNELYDQIPLERIGEFKTMLADAMVPGATLETNKSIIEKFAIAYVEALNDIDDAADSMDIETTWDNLYEKYQNYPSIIKMIRSALFGVNAAQEESSDAAQETSKSYDGLADSISNVSKALSLLESIRSDKTSSLEMIKSIIELRDMINESGGDLEMDQLIGVDESGKLVANIAEAEDALRGYIRRILEGSAIAEQYPEVIDAIVEEALAVDEATKSVLDFNDALSEVTKANDVLRDLVSTGSKASREDEIEYINTLYDFVERWNSIRKELGQDEIDLSYFIGYSEDAGIDFSNTAEKIREYKDAVMSASPAMQALEEKFPGIIDYFKIMSVNAEETADIIDESFNKIGDVFSYLNDLSNYESGNGNFFDQLEKAYRLAEKYDDIDLSNLISFGDDGIEFGRLADDTLNEMIDSLANAIGVTEDKLDNFREYVRNSFVETAEETKRGIDDAISDVSDAMSFSEAFKSYQKNDTSLLELLSKAQSFAENQKIDLSELIVWNDDGTIAGVTEYIDQAVSALYEELKPALDAAGVSWDEFYTHITSGEAAIKSVRDAISDLSSALDLGSTFNSYQGNGTSFLDMLDKAQSFAEGNGIDLSDVISWNDDGSISLLNDYIDIMATELYDKLKPSLDAAGVSWSEFYAHATSDAEKIKTVGNALSELSSAIDLKDAFASYQKNETSLLDILTKLQSFAESNDIDINNILMWNDDGSIEYMNSYIDDMAKILYDKLKPSLDAAGVSYETFYEKITESADGIETVSKALSDLSSALGLRSSYGSYQNGDTSFLDMLTKVQSFADNNKIDINDIIVWNDDGTIGLVNDYIDAMAETLYNKLKPSLDEAGISYETFYEKVTGSVDGVVTASQALSNMSSALSMKESLDSYRSGGTSLLDILTKLQSFADMQGIDVNELIFWGGDVSVGLIDESIDAFSRTLYDTFRPSLEAAGITYEQFCEKLTESEDDIVTLGDYLSDLNTAISYLGKHRAGDAVGEGLLDALSEFDKLREQFSDDVNPWTFNDFFEWNGEDFVYKVDILEEKSKELADHVVEDLGLQGEEAEKARDRILSYATDVETEFDRINDTLSKVKTVGSFSETIYGFKKGDTSLIDMFSEATSIAEKLGLTMDQVWDFEGMQPKAEAVYAAIDAAVDKLAESGGYSETFKQQLKEAARYAAEIASAQQRINDAQSKWSSRNNAISGFARDAELTYATYNELIESDRRYANAIEFVNGQLVINKQKYVEITKEIGNEVAAMADERIAQIKNSKEYIEYTKEFEKYGDKMDKGHLSALQNLELEIRGYQTLSSEIRNAADSFSAFMNASDATSGAYYSAVTNAKSIINDTLKNKKSDRYLKTGNEKYQLAYNILIGENVDINTPEFDAAMKKIDRYITDGEKGYNNFVRDLMKEGIVDASGNFNDTVDEMAQKLGVTRELVRAMLEEAEQYGAKIDWSIVDPDAAENESEKTKTIFDTIQDVSDAIDKLKENKMDIGANEAAESVAGVNEQLSGVVDKLDQIDARGGLNGVLIGSSGGVPSGAERMFAQQFIPDWYNGNVDLTSRKIIPVEALIKVGWDVDNDGGWATLFSSTFNGGEFGVKGASQATADMMICVTPITPDGTKILSPEELDEYVYELIEESTNTGRDIRDIDAEHLNLVVNIDTKNAEETIEEAYERVGNDMQKLHDLQEQWDILRSRYNWFGHDSDPNGVFLELSNGADSAQEAVKELSNTPVENDTTKAVTNIKSVGETANDAAKAIDKLNGKKVEIEAEVKPNASSGPQGGLLSRLFGGGQSAAGGISRSAHGGKTLVGELGREIVVDTDSGQWYVVGTNGPEIVNLPKNGIVFSNEDTEKILHGENAPSGARRGRSHSSSGVLGGLSGFASKVWDWLTGTSTSSTSNRINAAGNLPIAGGAHSAAGQAAAAVQTLADKLTGLKDKFDEVNAEYEHYIAHQEYSYYLSERAMNFDGMETALKNEIGYYQRIYDEAMKTVEAMKNAGATDTSKELQEVEEAAWAAKRSMNEVFDKMISIRVDELNNELGRLKTTYGNLATAADEYGRTGKISLDTFESLLDGGIQYLSFLDEQNGQYVIATDRLKDYITARKNQMTVESALSYIAQIKQALEEGETNRLDHLIDVTNEVTDSTWSQVYAQAALLKSAGLNDEMYQKLIDNLNRLRALSDTANTDIANDLNEKYKDQEDALKSILKYTEDLIRAESKDRIDAIKEEIDAYKEIINLKKESLQKTKEENDYQGSVADKVNEIAELQAKADMLSLDSSREAAVERQKILENIRQKQEELADLQADHSYDAQAEALEKEAEAYEASRQDEIDAIEDSISSEEKLYQLAIARIRDGWGTLYDELIEWNTEQGSVINDEITDAWNNAYEALKKYGDYLSAMAALNPGENGSGGNNLVVADIPKYHGGGVAGNKGKINDKEVLAVLEKDELVIDEKQKRGLYTVIDFVKTLGERLGTKIGNLRNFSFDGSMMPAYAGAGISDTKGIVENNNVTFNPTFTISINGDVGDAASAKEYGRTIAETAANSLYEAFSKRGIGVLQPLRQ